MRTTIVGVDCATDPRRVGLALGRFDGSRARVLQAKLGEGEEELVATIVGWIKYRRRILLAVDAPLGWPKALGESLAKHQAGEPIVAEPNTLFRRHTDTVVRSLVGKTPLDVGADRIARTAWAALTVLGELRARTREPIPLAWNHDFRDRVAAIEVYPAGTLAAYGLPATGYKKPEQRQAREAIIAGLRRTTLHLLPDAPLLLANADVLDAMVCVLAGADFLAGRAVAPSASERPLANKEGWIWVGPREAME